MNSPVQEELLGYVLGALDATEERDIQQKIENDPALQEEVRKLQASLAPLDCLETPPGVRPGLARRTCEWVAAATKNPNTIEDHYVPDHLSELAQTTAHADTASAIRTTPVAATDGLVDQPASATPAVDAGDDKVVLSAPNRFQLWHPHTWSLTDALVGVAVIAVMGAILFPAISYQRYNSRKIACQDNMRQIGKALLQYSDDHGGHFVAIPSAGRLSASGYFAPVLKDAGLIEDDAVFSCAGLASRSPVSIPSLARLAASDDQQLEYLKRNMSGHFGYSMGYRDGQKYRPLSNSGLTRTVLLADRPSTNQPGRRSTNHGTWGQNCLFGDGHIEFIRGDSVGDDAIFVNDYGIVAPGTSQRDSVIAPSHLSPAPR